MEGLKKYTNLYGLIPALILIIYAGLTGFFVVHNYASDFTFLSWVIPFSLSAGILVSPVGIFCKTVFRVIAFVVGLIMASATLFYFVALIWLLSGLYGLDGPIPPVFLVVFFVVHLIGILLGAVATFLVGLRAIGGE